MDGLAVVLLIVLLTIGFGLVFSKGQVDVVQRNWEKRRCEPGVMFAGFMYKPKDDKRSAAEFATENFNFCMKSFVKSAINTAMAPVIRQMDDTMNVAEGANKDIGVIRKTIGTIISTFNNTISEFMGVYNRTMMQAIRIATHIRMAFNRMFAIITAAFYAGLSSLFAGLNMFQFVIKVVMIILGILVALLIILIFVLFPFYPLIMSVIGLMASVAIIFTGVVGSELGGISNGFCFSGDTMIDMADGTKKPISVIQLGEKLKDGGEVEGTLLFDGSNVQLYNYNGVRVSGEHLVFDIGDKCWKKVSDTDAVLLEEKESYIYSLVTSKNRISANNILFADWEEFTATDPALTREWHKIVQRELHIPDAYKMPPTATSAHLSGNVMVDISGKQTPIYDVKIGDIIADNRGTTRVVGIYKCLYESTMPISQGVWRWAGTYWRQSNTSGFRGLVTPGELRYHLITESGTFTVNTGNKYWIRDFTEMGIPALKRVSGEVAKKISV